MGLHSQVVKVTEYDPSAPHALLSLTMTKILSVLLKTKFFFSHAPADTKPKHHQHLPSSAKSRVKLASKFPCRSRTGMSCAADRAWQKRGFDSLICN